MTILCTLTKNPIQSNFQNQSQKGFQKFHKINAFLTDQFLITKMP